MTEEDYDQGRVNQQRAPAISPFLLNVSAHCLLLLLTLYWNFERIRTLHTVFSVL